MADKTASERSWQRCGEHGGLVLEKRQRRHEVTGDHEGSTSQDIRVRDAQGRVVLKKEVTIRWSHFGQINAGFSDDGRAVVVTTSDGRDRVWKLP
ncbi:hypothetical protein [Shimia sediminis]|uniref:hypothetical protein n=1 Tax=Shimia sediminis TaxID=2497945 RepID=UPI000F8D0BE9|nr:hypothetical protein [Shimia sediminis]